jgi:thiosulfate dehydrogenase (quinone) large subunit
MALFPPSQVPPASQLTARQRWLGILRILFGGVWAVAALLKWQPAFIKGFADIVQGAMDGQPQVVKLWIAFWLGIIHVNSTLFAYGVAITETLLALCFILGMFTNLACVAGMLLSLGIWTVAEGFGGPYIAGQTVDVGTALPYAILCAVLLCVSAGQYYGLDHLLACKLGRFSFLASSPVMGVDEARVAQPVKEREVVRKF